VVILIDSSSWIHFLRPDGDSEVRTRVQEALQVGSASWCSLVRLELWNGAGGERERKVLREFERRIPELAIDGDVWNAACDLARRCRAAGVTVPATDILIASCAQHHGAALEHDDGDFDAIARVAAQGPSRPPA
jgi:predicted nucleic acid-binding protein